MTLRTRFACSILAFALLVAVSAAVRAEQTKPTAAPSAVNVTVKYNGKGGVVDANHRIWVWLFTSPDIGPGSTPIAVPTVTPKRPDNRLTGLSAVTKPDSS